MPEAATDKETALVDTGESAQGTFSPDGTRLLFISKNRPSHSHNQVYEKDLKSGEEVRITFQNGDTYFPRYHPKEPWIIYSSSTDELKENPPILQKPEGAQKLPEWYRQPLEIYQHSLKGLEISRLTDHDGFDGEAHFTRDGSGITWTRVKGQVLEVLTMKRNSKTPQVVKGLGPNPSQFTTSMDGKWRAWIDSDASFGVSKLKIQNGRKTALEVLPDMVVPKSDLFFSPDSKYLLWSQFNTATKNYQLWSVELETACARPLTRNFEGKGDRRYPALNAEMKVLAYTWLEKKRSRIMQLAWVAPTGPCATGP